MTRDDFKKIIKTARSFYPRERFVDNKADFDNWFSVFNDLDYEIADKALREYVKDNEYAPTVAGIRKNYEKIVDEEKKIRRDVNEKYGFLLTYFGERETKETKDKFWELVKSDTKDKIIQKAEWLRMAGYNVCEEKTLMEFLNGVIA